MVSYMTFVLSIFPHLCFFWCLRKFVLRDCCIFLVIFTTTYSVCVFIALKGHFLKNLYASAENYQCSLKPSVYYFYLDYDNEHIWQFSTNDNELITDAKHYDNVIINLSYLFYLFIFFLNKQNIMFIKFFKI